MISNEMLAFVKMALQVNTTAYGTELADLIEAEKVDGDVCVEGIYNTRNSRKTLLEICSHQDKKVCI